MARKRNLQATLSSDLKGIDPYAALGAIRFALIEYAVYLESLPEPDGDWIKACSDASRTLERFGEEYQQGNLNVMV